MKFRRTYSTPDDPYAGLTFEPRTSRIVNPDGSVIFEANDVMVPAGWSQVAVDVLAQKYCRKAGVPKATKPVPEEGVPEWLWRSEADETALAGVRANEQFGAERDARQVFDRMAGCWTYWGWKHGYFDIRERRAASISTRCARCSRVRSARRIRRNGLTPGCIGRTASPDRRKAISTSIRRRRSAKASSQHLRASASFGVLHPWDRRRSRQRRRPLRRRRSRSAHF